MPDDKTVSEDSKEQTQTDTSSGKEDNVQYQSDIDSQENFEKNKIKEEVKKEDKKEEDKTDDDKDKAQTKAKDERHANKKIQSLTQGKIDIAEKLLEKDPESIYELAESDPKLAEHFLKTDDSFGAKTLEELQTLQESDGINAQRAFKESKKTSREVAKIQKKLVDEQVRHMKEGNSDFDEELENKFRELVQQEAYEDVEPNRIIGVARALLGRDAPKKKSSGADVAAELLSAEQGNMPASGGSSTDDKPKSSPEFKRLQKAMGITDKQIKKHENAEIIVIR